MTDGEMSRRVDRLCRWLGAGGLLLVAATWKLWTPQDVFPRVPLLRVSPPDWCDWVALLVLLSGLGGLVASRPAAGSLGASWSRWRPPRSLAAALTASGFALQFLADQHRLQPWAWQFCVLATIVALADDRTIFHGWRWLALSIYAYSALSKFDLEFIQGTGAMFFYRSRHRLSPWLPIWLRGWLASTWDWAPAVLPAGELLIAVLLTWRRTRWWGYLASNLMHVGLLTILGPFGQNHSLGVLFWNVFFLVQNWWLFHEPLAAPEPETAAAAPPFPAWRLAAARGMLGFVLLWPLSEPWGLCDAWTGWAVYVPRFAKVSISLHPEEYERIPADRRAAFQPRHRTGRPGMDRIVVDVQRWSLTTLGVPTYPHPRFDLALALDFAARYDMEHVQVWLRPRDSRWKHFEEMPDVILDDSGQVWDYARRYRINAYPQSAYRRASAASR